MLILSELSEKYAQEICNWKYENEYSIYNYPDWQTITDQKWAITDQYKRQLEFKAALTVLNKQISLCGYFRFIVKNETIMLGLGLNPQFCGKGYGKQLMELIISEYKELHPDKILELEVRTFNKRAIQCYLRAGFSKTDCYVKETPIGKDNFLLMRYNITD